MSIVTAESSAPAPKAVSSPRMKLVGFQILAVAAPSPSDEAEMTPSRKAPRTSFTRPWSHELVGPVHRSGAPEPPAGGLLRSGVCQLGREADHGVRLSLVKLLMVEGVVVCAVSGCYPGTNQNVLANLSPASDVYAPLQKTSPPTYLCHQPRAQVTCPAPRAVPHGVLMPAS